MVHRRFLALMLVGLVGCSERTAERNPDPSPVAAPSSPLPAASTVTDASPGDAADESSRECAPGDEALQRYGTDCLCCHVTDFGIAGSVETLGPSIDRIEATDEEGVTMTMWPNAHSNFFRHYKPKGSLRITVIGTDGRASSMRARAPHGSCNQCHRPGGVVPRVRAP